MRNNCDYLVFHDIGNKIQNYILYYFLYISKYETIRTLVQP
jgi:hypothetical protein